MHPLLEKYFGFVKKMLPGKQASGTSVGLDIGSADVKLVEIAKTSEGYELISWDSEPIVNNDFSATIKKLMDKLENPCEAPITSIFGKGSLIRYIDLPRMSINDLKGSFDIEADKYFPFAQNQIYTDCLILDPDGKDKKMAVMAAAAKKELVDNRITLLNKLDLQVNFIGLNPIALANVINACGVEGSDDSEGATALLDMGESVSSLTILINNVPRFTRDIFVGGRDLTKSISNALGMNQDEAEAIKRNPKDRGEEVVSACETAISNIVQELKLSFDYFTTEKNAEIKQLLITGGGSMLEGINELLEKNLDVKTINWNPVSKFKIRDEINNEHLMKNASMLGVASGLALYAYD